VATLGTALTAQSARVLGRLCRNVVLLFDGDDAGQRAADRAVEVFFASDLDVRIATLAAARARGEITAKDPDELLKQPGGAEKLRAVFDAAIDALDYRLLRFRQRLATLNFSARATAVEDELNRLIELGLAQISPIRRQMIVRRIAVTADIPEETVRAAIATASARAGASRQSKPDATATTPTGVVGEMVAAMRRDPAAQVLGCVVADPSLLQSLRDEERVLLAPVNFPESSFKKMAEVVDSLQSLAQPFSTKSVLRALDDAEAERVVTGVVLELERMTQNDPQQLRLHFRECVAAALQRRAVDSAKSAGESLERIASLRALTSRLGKDARTLPRPLS
jgi:DNA primase